ncbi:ABC transporter permease [Prescottella subtropica]|uniref:ABC transporter permease n=1 Tax=Prescottella subtropica TaxID=2545757 RepID=UPI001386AD63|nr:ABC transporter permease [Prescottella subtropica]
MSASIGEKNAEPTTREDNPNLQPPRSARSSSVDRATLVELAEKYGLLALLIVLIGLFALASPLFFTPENFTVILGARAGLVILALAAIPPLIAGRFDLSIGATMGVASIVAASLMSHHHLPLWLAATLTIGLGMVIGLVNGLIIAYTGANPLIITLGMSTLLLGLAQWYTAGESISQGVSPGLIRSASGSVAGIPTGLLWVIPIGLVLWYMHAHTPLGRHMTSVGSNSAAAALVGLPVRRIEIGSYVMAGALAAVAGLFQLGQLGSADPQMAAGHLLLPALVAAFLGTAAFTPGAFNFPGAILAVYFVAFSVSGLQFMGAASWVEPIFNGVALIVAMCASVILGRKRGRRPIGH